MNKLKPFLSSVAVDAIFAALFVWGVIYGNENAANVFLFFTWFYVLSLWLLAGVMMSVKPSDRLVARSRWLTFHDNVKLFIRIIFVVAMVWVGWIALPALYLIGYLLVWGAKKSLQKKALEQAGTTEEAEAP
ncbi:hypothetical protein AGMMS50256_35920 [Betaproteobacteria bacterium]|nr:hypothetical protein AGMMS50256_35920 [Betaproteobacteria bacterium]